MNSIFQKITDLWNTFINLLPNHQLWGVPFLGYILALLLIILLTLLGFRLLRILKIFFIAFLTKGGRITRVRSIVDGDTIKVSHFLDHKRIASIRMIGIDAPESLKSTYMDIAPFGKEASDFVLSRLKPGQLIIMLYDKSAIDPFNRELVYLYLPWGELFNATLVRKGYAFAIYYPPNGKNRLLFEKLEAKARKKELGLWKIYESRGVLRKSYKKSVHYRNFKKNYGKFEEKLS